MVIYMFFYSFLMMLAGLMRATFRMRKMTVNAVMVITASKIPPQ